MRLCLLPFLMAGTAAVAEPAKPPIEQKIDALQKQLDQLKAQLPTKPSTDIPSKQATAPTASGATSFRPGWVVSVFPETKEGQTSFSVGRFIAKPGGFQFGDFRKTMPHPGWASFKGIAFYNVTEEGTYTFSIVIGNIEKGYWRSGTSCKTTMRVANTDIFTSDKVAFSADAGRPYAQSVSGGVELKPLGHPIEFTINCKFNDEYMDHTSDDVFRVREDARPYWDKTSVRIDVFGPNDMGARPPKDSELVHEMKSGSR